jgi:hypothetical protein
MRTGAIAHGGNPTPPTERVGGLIWWIFHNSDSEPEALVQHARTAGFPAIFLPLPHPVGPEVAFQRGLDRATAMTPGESRLWRADRVLRPTRLSHRRPAGGQATAKKQPDPRDRLTHLQRGYGEVPDRIEQAILDHSPELAVAVVQSWEPVWRIYLWCAMRCDEAARRLPLSEVLITVPAVTGPPARSRAEGMQERMRDRVARVLDHATAPEIGEGVVDALEEVGGVKLRPGLFSLPGEAGLRRGEAVLRYLASVGDTQAGMYDLYEGARGGAKPGLVLSVLRDEMTALDAKVRELDVREVGVGALRTLWFETREFAERLSLNEALLGEHLSGLKANLEATQRLLARKAAEKKTARDKPVPLEPSPTSGERERLAEALRRLALAAQGTHPDVTALGEANDMLGKAQGAVRERRLRLLVRRLRRLVEATCHALEVPAGAAGGRPRRRGQPARPGERATLFQGAVTEAIAHVEERLVAQNLLDGHPGAAGT